ncbi:MAG: HD domain-containing protein [Proteobacteria bacterium]|nr:HD domain-containing protein [Pseudomonadota bacterium]
MNFLPLTLAFDFAQKIHRNQKWKQTERPFLYHPLRVASLVLFYGGNESEAQAALLHDTISAGVTCDELEVSFGKIVADLVRAFQDPPEIADHKIEWSEIKKAYLNKMETLPPATVFIIACEELEELSVLLHDLKFSALQVWAQYPVPGRDVGWYFNNLTKVFYKKLIDPKYHQIVSEFASQTKILSRLVFEGIDI